MSEKNANLVERLREAMKDDPQDTPLGKAIARLKEPFFVGDGNQFYYDKFVVMFVAIREALHEIDPTIEPNVPPFLLDPTFIAKFFGIPLEKFNYQGGQQTGVEPEIVQQLEKIVGLLKTYPVKVRKHNKLNQTETKILKTLGEETLTGEEIAKLAHYPYNANLKQTLSSLVKREILGNNNPGYFRR